MILLLGATGLLGKEVHKLLPEAVAASRAQLDLAEEFELPPGQWDWIIDCAAYTAVDRAESEPDLARQINALGPKRLAKLARGCGARLLHVSTDFVYGGNRDRPFREGDSPAPLGIYARTKLEGDVAVLAEGEEGENIVVPTAWLFGDGPCFPRSIVRAWSSHKPLRVVDDQIGSPSYAPDVAAAIALLIRNNAPGGLYHAAGTKAMSWHELALRALRAWRQPGDDRPIAVEPIPSAEYPTAAPRPKYSVLDVSRMLAMGWRPRHIDDALADWARRLHESGEAL